MQRHGVVRKAGTGGKPSLLNYRLSNCVSRAGFQRNTADHLKCRQREILLAKAELLDAFVEAVRQPVVMPKEVERGCYGRREALDAHLIARAITEKRITVRVVRQQKQYEKLRCDFPLGRGEAEAVTLALASEGALVATDDRQAINACKLLKIPFITALTVLVRMREKGLLSTEEARSKLEMLARYGRYKERTIDAARLELEGK